MEGIGMDLEQPTDSSAIELLKNKKMMGKSKGLVATPVALGASGEGLPYAPEDWPCPGDKWRWKVGKRVSNAGYYVDRFLYPPPRYDKSKIPGGKGGGLASRHLVEKFVRKKVPDVDLHLFFSSFLWRVPSPKVTHYKDVERENLPCLFTKQYSGRLECKSTPRVGECKAGNKMCCPRLQSRGDSLIVMDCDICCTEDGFCRDCCCILCGWTIDLAYGGYNFIKCEAMVDENIICGHVAHIDCALRAYLAGTVRGSIELDVEYYCRRCDNKSDLISHLLRLLPTCESINSRDDIEKILKLGLCILHGSGQTRAKDLRAYIQSIIAKLRNGISIVEVWKLKDDMQMVASGSSHFGDDMVMLGTHNGECYQRSFDITIKPEVSFGKESIDSKASNPVYITSDHSNASMKIENDIDKALVELKKSQESEYRLAEEKLYVQKYFLINLYQQLDRERMQLASPTLSNGDDSDSLLSNILCKVDQIRHEETKLTQMMLVSQGFGQVPKHILMEHFGLQLRN